MNAGLARRLPQAGTSVGFPRHYHQIVCSDATISEHQPVATTARCGVLRMVTLRIRNNNDPTQATTPTPSKSQVAGGVPQDAL